MSLEARLEWRSPIAAHIDRLVIEPTALQGDARLLAAGEGLHHTEEVSLDAAPWCQPAGLALLELAAADVRPGLKPMVDRFYPRAAFAKLPGSARDLRPLKLIAVNAETATLRVDPNHPLAETPARLNLRRSPYPAAPGVRLADLFSGPGMQVPAADPAATYFAGNAFARGDERGDAAFYAVPRLTQHLDANCRVASADFHSRLLLPGMRVLDLMASCDSHLPAAPADLQVCGLGMNAEELAANPRLGARVVQDLNACPALPWPDAAACRDEFYRRLVPATADHRSSMLQDLERGRRTEIDACSYCLSWDHMHPQFSWAAASSGSSSSARWQDCSPSSNRRRSFSAVPRLLQACANSGCSRIASR